MWPQFDDIVKSIVCVKLDYYKTHELFWRQNGSTCVYSVCRVAVYARPSHLAQFKSHITTGLSLRHVT